jgi:hypothetical protein
MTLSGGASSGSSHGTRSLGSEGDMVHRMELMRKRRMESNRESAKRSRQRKQQHLDDLNSQVRTLFVNSSCLPLCLFLHACLIWTYFNRNGEFAAVLCIYIGHFCFLCIEACTHVQVNLTQSKSQMKKTRLVLQDMLKQANSDNARCPLISQGPPPN